MAETKLDNDITKPQTTQPGDAPYDTTDPTEQASTVTPRPGPEAIAEGTVNGAVKVPTKKTAAKKAEDARYEEYEATKPNGDVVRIKRNMDTGESEIVTK